MSKVERPAKVNTEHEWVGAAWAEKAQLYMDQLESELGTLARYVCATANSQTASDAENIARRILNHNGITVGDLLTAERERSAKLVALVEDSIALHNTPSEAILRPTVQKIADRLAAILAPKEGADE